MIYQEVGAHMRILPLGFFLLSYPLVVDAKECSPAEAETAENATDSLHSWEQIYTAYSRYRHCDEAAIAQGFTDKVVHLLATDWGTLAKLDVILQRDPQFLGFVVRHINGSADPAELDKVIASANSACPFSMHSLCKQLTSAASEQYHH